MYWEKSYLQDTLRNKADLSSAFCELPPVCVGRKRKGCLLVCAETASGGLPEN